MEKKDTGGGGGVRDDRMSRRERRMLQHRGEIIEAATELFARQGYEKTGMQQIAEQAELSVGKLYTHFKGKEAIYREIVEHHVEELHERSDEACLPGMSWLERIRARIRVATDYFAANSMFLRFYWERNPGCRDELGRKADDENIKIIKEDLDNALREGEIETDIDSWTLAVLMEGAAHRYVETVFARGGSFERLPEYLDKVFLRPIERKRQGGDRYLQGDTGNGNDDKKERS